jgi:hypothetical protein
MHGAYILANDLIPPAAGGYTIVLVAPLGVGGLLYRLLLAYYRRRNTGPARPSPLTAMSDFLSVLGVFLRYRSRGWILIPTILALPVGYFAALPIVPTAAGKENFATTYASFFVAAAAMTSALLIAVALQVRTPSRQTRFVTREADLVAVIWTVVAEAAVLAMLSPSFPMDLQRPAFRLMFSGTVSGLIGLVLGSIRSDVG